MERYLWDAYQDDGLVMPRWSLDGFENNPDPWKTRQFHLYTLTEPRRSVWLDIPKGAHFHCGWRVTITEQLIFFAGWDMTDDVAGAWLFLTPDEGIELASEARHITRFERQ